MKTTTVDDLIAYLADAEGAYTDFNNTSRFIAQNNETLVKLELECDLTDAKGLAEITRRQTIKQLGPSRHDHRHGLVQEKLGLLKEAGDRFISTQLAPRIGAVRRAADAKIRADLQGLGVFDREAIDAAVETSAIHARLRGLESVATIRTFFREEVEGDKTYSVNAEYVKRLIDAWHEAEEIAASLSKSAPKTTPATA